MSGLVVTPFCPVTLAVQVVQAYVANNPITMADVPVLLASVSRTLKDLKGDDKHDNASSIPPQYANTVTNDYIISLEDGRPYRSLRRHLQGRGLTPEQYRKKWDLPPDYPMVAPSFSAMRADQARNRATMNRERPDQADATVAGPPSSPGEPDSRSRGDGDRPKGTRKAALPPDKAHTIRTRTRTRPE